MRGVLQDKSNKQLGIFCSALLFIWLSWALYGLFLNYSFWLDELFSVVVAKQDFSERMQIYLVDVHPPLYQEILSSWFYFFPADELSARLLSIFFAGLSFLSFFFIRRKFGELIALLVLMTFLSNSYVYFYAQEVRSYGLLLLLSAFATFFFVSGNKRAVFLLLVPLAMTHFFGALLAGLISFYIFIDGNVERKEKIYSVACMFACCIWPAVYIFFGQASDVAGGSFWIQTGSLGTVLNTFQAASPGVMALLRKASSLGVPLVLGLALVFAVLSFVLTKAYVAASKDLRIAMVKALYICAGTTAVAVIIGLHTPISTVRNHIIIVPAASFLLGVAIWGMLQVAPRWLVAIIALAYVALGHAQLTRALLTKMEPQQEWRLSSELAEQEASSGRLFVWGERRDNYSLAFQVERRAYYFSDYETVQLVSSSNISMLELGDVAMFGQLAPSDREAGSCSNIVTETLSAIGVSYRVYFAPQSWMCQNGYVVIE